MSNEKVLIYEFYKQRCPRLLKEKKDELVLALARCDMTLEDRAYENLLATIALGFGYLLLPKSNIYNAKTAELPQVNDSNPNQC